MKKYILFILSVLPSILLSQNWSYNRGNNKFDGTYKIASVSLHGGNSPYNTPSLILKNNELTNNVSLYINNSGYYQSNTKLSVELMLDNSDKNYEVDDFSLSTDGSAIFLNSLVLYNKSFEVEERFNIYKLIDLLSQKSKVFFRISDDFKTIDLSASLVGSSKAISYAVPNLLSKLDEYEAIQEDKIKMRADVLDRNKKLIRKLIPYLDSVSLKEITSYLLNVERLYDKSLIFKDVVSDSISVEPYFLKNVNNFIRDKKANVYFVAENGEKQFLKSAKLSNEYFNNNYLNDDHYSNSLVEIKSKLIKWGVKKEDAHSVLVFIKLKDLSVKSVFLSTDGVSASSFGYRKVGLSLNDESTIIMPYEIKLNK